MKSLPFIDVSNPIWYLLRSDSKRSFITSSVFPWIKISELSLFECITRSSSVSLEEVKLIANCYLNFPRFFEIIYDVSQVWFHFIQVFFDLWGFVSIIITFIFDIIVAIKVTYSYWFVIIFLFKQLLHISNYSVLDCFNYFVF